MGKSKIRRTQMFVVIEMADVELLAVHCIESKKKADELFDSCAEENSVVETSELSLETVGTLRLAGDDSYSVHLLECQIQ